MHEMSVMSYLLETVQAEAVEHGARKVLAVNLVMGDRASVFRISMYSVPGGISVLISSPPPIVRLW